MKGDLALGKLAGRHLHGLGSHVAEDDAPGLLALGRQLRLVDAVAEGHCRCLARWGREKAETFSICNIGLVG